MSKKSSPQTPVAVDATTLDLILRSHCKAELAKAKYWVDNGNEPTKEFFVRSAAFWEAMLASKEPFTNVLLFAEFKRNFDDQEKKRFPGNPDTSFLVMPSVSLRVSNT